MQLIKLTNKLTIYFRKNTGIQEPLVGNCPTSPTWGPRFPLQYETWLSPPVYASKQHFWGSSLSWLISQPANGADSRSYLYGKILNWESHVFLYTTVCSGWACLFRVMLVQVAVASHFRLLLPVWPVCWSGQATLIRWLFVRSVDPLVSLAVSSLVFQGWVIACSLLLFCHDNLILATGISRVHWGPCRWLLGGASQAVPNWQ